jgi:hypothetical protein
MRRFGLELYIAGSMKQHSVSVYKLAYGCGISWREQVNFHLNGNDVHFVLDQHPQHNTHGNGLMSKYLFGLISTGTFVSSAMARTS